MKAKIAFLVPYFGSFPNYFPLWLESCRHNTEVDWIIYTDDKTKYDYPPNAKVFYTNFKNLKEKIQALFEFRIALNTPYKLCDFKPAYGHIFEKDIAGYDFWGHCDIDLIFGNILNFVTDDILDNYDRIFSNGHFCLYRNNQSINRWYKDLKGVTPHFKVVFSSKESFAFDESGRREGMNKLVRINNKRQYNKITFDDLIPKHRNFVSTRTGEERKGLYHSQIKKLPALYQFKDGILLQHILIDNTIYKSESMYVHFQKRPMKLKLLNKHSSSFVIIPNSFVDDEKITIDLFKKCKYQYTYLDYIISALIRKLRKLLMRRY